MIVTVGVISVRYYNESCHKSGRHWEDRPENLRPSFGSHGAGGAWSANFLLLVCMTTGKWRLEADFPIGLMCVRIIMGAIGTGSAHSLTTTTTTKKNSWQ